MGDVPGPVEERGTPLKSRSAYGGCERVHVIKFVVGGISSLTNQNMRWYTTGSLSGRRTQERNVHVPDFVKTMTR